MNSSIDLLIDSFRKKRLTYEKFSIKLLSLINEILQANQILPHQTTCRIKDEGSLSQKIERKLGKYKSLDDITDIVGVRIITYLEDEVDKIAEILNKEFSIDIVNSVDKRILDTDKFGYRSLHFVLSLSKERLEFIENKSFVNIKAEIQVRSILQHAWAEIEHDIGYKGEIEIPQFAKRSFYRIAALLETADIEFVKLKDTLRKYEFDVSKSIESNPQKVLLDKASLSKYVKESNLVKKIDGEIKKYLNSKTIDVEFDDFNEILSRLYFFKASTIKDLDNLLEEYQTLILPFLVDFTPIAASVYKNSLPQGICLFYLTFILAAKENDLSKTIEFCKKFKLNDKYASNLVESYKRAVSLVKKVNN